MQPNTHELFPGCGPAGHYLSLLYQAALDSAQYTGPCLAAALSAQLVYQNAILPLLATAGTIYLTRAIVVCIKNSTLTSLKEDCAKLSQKVYDLDKQFPYVAHLAMAVSIIASLWFNATFVVIPAAIYIGLKIEADRIIIKPNKQIHSTRKEKEDPI